MCSVVCLIEPVFDMRSLLEAGFYVHFTDERLLSKRDGSYVQLDQAAPLLADGEPPIVVAKINADKYRSAVEKYDIRCIPIFIL